MGGVFNSNKTKNEGEIQKWGTPDDNQTIFLGRDIVQYSDGTRIGYIAKEEIHPKRTAYEKETLSNNLLVIWNSVFILIKIMIKKPQN